MPKSYNRTVLAIPHSSTELMCKDEFIDPELAKRDSLLLSDLYADELYLLEGSYRLKARYSRISLDVERYWDDGKEVMAKVGMGKIYTRSISGKSNRYMDRISWPTYGELYDQYHRGILWAVESIGPGALLIDCHTFNPDPFSFDVDQDTNRPDLCIGFNDDKTKPDGEMLGRLVGKADELGMKAAFNRPFGGSMTVDTKVPYTSIMLELNKRLYLKEDMSTKKGDFRKTAESVQKLLKNIGR